MARITVEDCVTIVPNRFELVLLAAARARQISAGEEPRVSLDNDKGTIIALREVADGVVDCENLREDVISALQVYSEPDLPDEEEMEMQNLGDRFAEIMAEEMAEAQSKQQAREAEYD